MRVLEEKDLQKAFLELKDDDVLIRCDAAASLYEYNEDEKVKEALKEALNDSNYLVRCEACDSLYGLNDRDILDCLLKALKKERSAIARMYIVSTVSSVLKEAGIAENEKSLLISLAEKEESKRVIIAYQALLYLIDRDKDHILKALSYLNDPNYHIRCNAVNLVYDAADEEVLDIVISGFEERLKAEKVFCVEDLLKKCLEELKQSKT